MDGLVETKIYIGCRCGNEDCRCAILENGNILECPAIVKTSENSFERNASTSIKIASIAVNYITEKNSLISALYILQWIFAKIIYGFVDIVRNLFEYISKSSLIAYPDIIFDLEADNTEELLKYLEKNGVRHLLDDEGCLDIGVDVDKRLLTWKKKLEIITQGYITDCVLIFNGTCWSVMPK